MLGLSDSFQEIEIMNVVHENSGVIILYRNTAKLNVVCLIAFLPEHAARASERTGFCGSKKRKVS